MPDFANPVTNRRDFLKAAAATTALSALAGGTRLHAADRPALPVAAIVTVWFRHSHTDVIVGKILEGWQHDGGPGPDLKLVSMYVDQVGESDLSRQKAERHGFQLARTIDEAITLGSNQVQVAGVLSIGEHGDYPTTPDTKQPMYPRRRFFEQIAAAFQRCGKVVPVFNDKHLAYRWEDAKFMVDTAGERNIPLLAGSSVPLAWRMPPLELDRNAELESAITVGYSGLEIYGIHALEAHQAMIERRRGGEAGIVSVQALQGDAIHRAAAEGRWPVELFQTALATLPGAPQAQPDWTTKNETALYLLEHRDGLKSAVVMIGALAPEFAFAAKLKGRPEPVATWIRLQNNPPHGHFAQQLRAIEETIHTGRAVYPVERTLLTTGTLDRLMHSLAQHGTRFDTPELAIAYQPTDWPFANHPQTRLKLPDPS
ncbi:MAG: twin-arginine translocation signal domain-containing protein [Planctomycetaceae bacterium]|nr:twin-arginine translocation signal domain-containing protein [Planctomycetaceae bacterium]